MSLTPGWIEKEVGKMVADTLVVFAWGHLIQADKDFYYLDNDSEYKRYPGNQEGWAQLCDDRKGFAP